MPLHVLLKGRPHRLEPLGQNPHLVVTPSARQVHRDLLKAEAVRVQFRQHVDNAIQVVPPIATADPFVDVVSHQPHSNLVSITALRHSAFVNRSSLGASSFVIGLAETSGGVNSNLRHWRKNSSGLSYTIFLIFDSGWPRLRSSWMKSGTAIGLDGPQSPAEFTRMRSSP